MSSTSTTTQASPQAPEKARERGGIAFALFSHAGLICWSALVIVPLLWTFFSSFKSSSEIFGNPFGLPRKLLVANYSHAWTDAGIGRSLFNTIIVVGVALVLVMVLGAMCSYVLARFRFPGNRVVYYLMLAGLTFPIFLAIVPLFFILKNMGLVGTLPGLILVYVAYALPFTVFFLHAFFQSLPQEIYEAAQIDGAGEWRTFFQVMLPMAKSGMIAVSIFNFLGLWNQYLLPIALNPNESNYVLSQSLGAFASAAKYGVDYGALFAAVVITIAPVLVVYVLFQRQLQGSVSQGTMK